MKPQTRSNEAGWVLLEAVLLGMIVLGSAAAIGISARTALLEEHAAARMEAALLTRARFSMMEADLDQGIPPPPVSLTLTSNGRVYRVETTVVRRDDFYDVSLRLSWQILGREEQADFVRRLRQHVHAESIP